MFEKLPDSVSIYEVSPRDGLQNEATPISLEGKLELLKALIAAGLTRIELTSFVSPRWVPQLADAEALAKAAAVPAGGTVSALGPKAQGFETRRPRGLKRIPGFISPGRTPKPKKTTKATPQSP